MARTGAGGAGAAPITAGSLRLSLDVVGALDLDGGHLEDQGLSPAGQVIAVALHDHEVELDFLHLELSLRYAVSDSLELVARLPYEIKRTTARISLIEPLSAADLAAAQANLEIHHRSETLEGPGDPMLLVEHRFADLGSAGHELRLGLGLTLPVGQTERDPFELGEQGRRHQHLQLGTGTVDPLVEFGWHVSLVDGVVLLGRAAARIPLYENRKTFRAAAEVTAALGVGAIPFEGLSLQLEAVGFWQGRGYWDGERDENTGLVSVSVDLRVALQLAQQVSLSIGLRQPMYLEITDDDGDGYEQSTMLLLSLAWSLD